MNDQRRSASRGIFSAAATVAALTAAARLMTALKDVVVARHFGTGHGIGVFLIAYMLPTTLVSVLAGASSTAIVPTFVRLRERRSVAESHELLSSITTTAVLILAATAVILCLCAGALLRSLIKLSGEELELGIRLVYLMAPIVPLGGIAAVWSGALNGTNRFAVASIVPIITPVIVVASLFGGTGPGVYRLAVGTTIGAAVEVAALGAAMVRAGLPIVPAAVRVTPAIRDVTKQYFPIMIGSIVFGGTNVVDQTIAARMGQEALATLGYGGKAISFALAIGATAVGTVALPHFSRLAAVNDLHGIRRTLRKYALLLTGGSVPAAALLIALSKPVVAVVFQRGAFTVSDTAAVARVQSAYAVQIPFYVLTIMGVRVLSAMMMNRVLFFQATFLFFLNWLLDIWFARFMGVAGIALSTSAVSIASLVIIYTCIAVATGRSRTSPGA